MLKTVELNSLINWFKEHEKFILYNGEMLQGNTFLEMAKFAANIDNKEALLKMRIMYVDEIPFPKEFYQMSEFKRNIRGLTCGYGIYIDKKYKDDMTLLFHEYIHVLQHIKCDGIDKFIEQYIIQYMEYGYIDMPFEKEAIEILLEHGTNPNIKTTMGNTIFDLS